MVENRPEQSSVTQPANLIARLAAVESAVSRIPKTGYNERQDYHYVTESDVMDCIRSNLAAHGVVIRHDVVEFVSEWRDSRNGGAMQWVRVKVTFWAEADNGEKLDLGCMYGQGIDSGEKAIYKAITGAVKYKLLKQFLMSSGDDPEAEKRPIHQQRSSSGRPSNEGTAGRGGATPSAPTSAPTVFPNFGKAKGEPIKGAAIEALEFHLAAARKSLADPDKAKWHARDSALIGTIEAELARQRGAVPEGKQETKSAPAEKPSRVVDQQDGETEEHAKQRAAAAFYHQAVKAGGDHGWEPKAVGEWLRKNRGRGGKQEVTAEDVALFVAHFEPPAEPGAAG